jgi:hypothetical protein
LVLGIYNYIGLAETNRVSRVYNFTAAPCNVISHDKHFVLVPSAVWLLSAVVSFRAFQVRYSRIILNDLEIVQVAPIITGTNFVFAYLLLLLLLLLL